MPGTPIMLEDAIGPKLVAKVVDVDDDGSGDRDETNPVASPLVDTAAVGFNTVTVVVDPTVEVVVVVVVEVEVEVMVGS